MDKKINGMIRLKVQILLSVFILFALSAHSQYKLDVEVNKEFHFLYSHPKTGTAIIEKEYAETISQSGDSYYLMNLRSTLGAINAVILVSEEKEFWIQEQITLINNVINSAEISSQIPNNTSFLDNYKGWVSLRTGESNESTLNKEIPLYESYLFFYVTHFLYILDELKWVNKSDQNESWWQDTLAFVEQHVWTKWAERSLTVHHNYYNYFLRGRTHMGSHWAGTAMYLNKLSSNPQIKLQAITLVEQYDTLLRRNLIEVGQGYIWNSTYDDVEGTDGIWLPQDVLQDVAHGNHVVSYLVEAHKFGNVNWTLADINRMVYTMKHYMYDANNIRFYDMVDGSVSTSRQGWGNFIADGWVKLAEYDEELKLILLEFQETDMLRQYNQEFQFKGNMYKFRLQDD